MSGAATATMPSRTATDPASEAAWLDRQCRMLDARAGAVALVDEADLKLGASWPNPGAAAALSDILGRAAMEGSGLYARVQGDSHRSVWAVAYPVMRAGAVRAVAAFLVRGEDGEAPTGIMRQLEWGVAGLHLVLVLRDHLEDSQRAARAAESLDVLARMLAEARFDSAALSFVTELAGRHGFERVSYGVVTDGVVELSAISHSGDFRRKLTVARLIEAAMQEAADQRMTVAWPQAAGAAPLVALAAERLADQNSGGAVSLPLFLNESNVAVLTVETRRDEMPTAATLARLESLGTIVAACLNDKWYRARPAVTRLWLDLRTVLGQVFGSRHAGVKLAAVGTLCLLLFLGVTHTEERLAADATLVSHSQQVIASPFAGYISSAPARAGDRLRAGDLLAALDDRDMQLDRLRLLGELARTEGQHQRSVAERDRARMGIHAAERDQYIAQLNLVNEQLQRTRLLAPFDSLVVSGDLSQRLGGAVERGEALFAIAPAGQYRIDLRVKESRIADVAVGHHGTLLLSALPGSRVDFVVSRVTPRVVSSDGQSYFVVEATLNGPVEIDLQPGMQGVGRILVGHSSYLSIWTRELREWLRLFLWVRVP